MPVAFVWFMVILSFPLGVPGVFVAGFGWPLLMNSIGFSYMPFRDELPIWVVAVVLGYWQWFVMLPRVANWLLSRSKRGEA
jgi:hypothetical protein